MIRALKSLFEMPAQETGEQLQHRLNLAAAALLLETARADFSQDADEEAALLALLRDNLELNEQDLGSLLQEADQRLDVATSLYEFTKVINDHYSAVQKLQLVGSMWKVAYADGDLDKYEEHLIRQVAELTYVPHAQYIKCKLAAQTAANS